MEKSQRFGHWVWIAKRYCEDCEQEHRIVAGDTRRRPQLPPGAMYCTRCNGVVRF